MNIEPTKAAKSRPTAFLPNPKAKLFDQVREVCRLKHFSLRTEEAYLGWIRRFVIWARDHPELSQSPQPQPLAYPLDEGTERAKRWRHPRDLGAAEVTAYLSHLATVGGVAASTQNQAMNALIFLYQEVLHQPVEGLADRVRAWRPLRLPVVLIREEVGRLLQDTTQLMAQLLYGTGLRLLECLRLRVKDLDFARGVIVVREGKGDKDRASVLPQPLREPLQRHLERVRLLHQRDLAEGWAG